MVSGTLDVRTKGLGELAFEIFKSSLNSNEMLDNFNRRLSKSGSKFSVQTDQFYELLDAYTTSRFGKTFRFQEEPRIATELSEKFVQHFDNAGRDILVAKVALARDFPEIDSHEITILTRDILSDTQVQNRLNLGNSTVNGYIQTLESIINPKAMTDRLTPGSTTTGEKVVVVRNNEISTFQIFSDSFLGASEELINFLGNAKNKSMKKINDVSHFFFKDTFNFEKSEALNGLDNVLVYGSNQVFGGYKNFQNWKAKNKFKLPKIKMPEFKHPKINLPKIPKIEDADIRGLKVIGLFGLLSVATISGFTLYENYYGNKDNITVNTIIARKKEGPGKYIASAPAKSIGKSRLESKVNPEIAKGKSALSKSPAVESKTVSKTIKTPILPSNQPLTLATTAAPTTTALGMAKIPTTPALGKSKAITMTTSPSKASTKPTTPATRSIANEKSSMRGLYISNFNKPIANFPSSTIENKKKFYEKQLGLELVIGNATRIEKEKPSHEVMKSDYYKKGDILVGLYEDTEERKHVKNVWSNKVKTTDPNGQYNIGPAITERRITIVVRPKPVEKIIAVKTKGEGKRIAKVSKPKQERQKSGKLVSLYVKGQDKPFGDFYQGVAKQKKVFYESLVLEIEVKPYSRVSHGSYLAQEIEKSKFKKEIKREQIEDRDGNESIRRKLPPPAPISSRNLTNPQETIIQVNTRLNSVSNYQVNLEDKVVNTNVNSVNSAETIETNLFYDIQSNYLVEDYLVAYQNLNERTSKRLFTQYLGARLLLRTDATEEQVFEKIKTLDATRVKTLEQDYLEAAQEISEIYNKGMRVAEIVEKTEYAWIKNIEDVYEAGFVTSEFENAWKKIDQSKNIQDLQEIKLKV